MEVPCVEEEYDLTRTRERDLAAADLVTEGMGRRRGGPALRRPAPIVVAEPLIGTGAAEWVLCTQVRGHASVLRRCRGQADRPIAAPVPTALASFSLPADDELAP